MTKTYDIQTLRQVYAEMEQLFDEGRLTLADYIRLRKQAKEAAGGEPELVAGLLNYRDASWPVEIEKDLTP